MKNHTASMILACLLVGVISPAMSVEIEPFVGQRFGGTFQDGVTQSDLDIASATTKGVMIDFDTEPNKQVELFLSRQSTYLKPAGPFTGNPLFHLDIDYYHIGGLYFPDQWGYFHPFISGSAGITNMTPDGPGLTSLERLSISIGGGTKVYFNKNVGMRLDGRAIYTAINSDTQIFCSGGCNIRIVSSGFWQTEIGAALIFKF